MKKQIVFIIIVLAGCKSPSNTYNHSFSGEIFRSIEYAAMHPQILTLNDSIKMNLESLINKCPKEIIADSTFENTLVMCDSLIESDSSFLEAYFNKSLLFRLIDSLDGAIAPLEKIDDIYNEPKASFLLGVYYEMNGHDSLSILKFAQAVSQYEIYSEYPTYTIDDMYYRAQARLFLYGRKEVLRQTRKLLFKYPFDFELRLQRRIARDFNHEIFLDYY